MFCIECGNQLPESAKFCNRCGSQQPQVHQTSSWTNANLTPTQTFAMPPVVNTREVPSVTATIRLVERVRTLGYNYHFELSGIGPLGVQLFATSYEWKSASRLQIPLPQQGETARKFNDFIQFLYQQGWEFVGQGAEWHHLTFRRPTM